MNQLIRFIFILILNLPGFSTQATKLINGNSSDLQTAIDNIPETGGDRQIELEGTFTKSGNNIYIDKNNISIKGISNPILDRIIFLIDAHNVKISGITFRDHGLLEGEVITIGNLPANHGYPFTDKSTTNLSHSNTVEFCVFENMFTRTHWNEDQQKVVGESGTVFRVRQDTNNYGNQFSDNHVTLWGNPLSTVHIVKIGSNRLQDNGNHIGHPVFSQKIGSVNVRTKIERNIITGEKIELNSFLHTSNQSSVIQLYNPTDVIDNTITYSFKWNFYKGKQQPHHRKYPRIYAWRWRPIYEGRRSNIFLNNTVKNSKSGFYAWSGKQSILKQCLFPKQTYWNNPVCLSRWRSIRQLEHGDDPLTDVRNLIGQTSYMFTNDETVFANNTFYKNKSGIQWSIWTSQTNYNKPRNMYFINNIFWADDNSNNRDSLFVKWNPGDNSDMGGIPNDPIKRSLYLYNNIFYNGFNGLVPEAYLAANASNTSGQTRAPARDALPHLPPAKL